VSGFNRQEDIAMDMNELQQAAEVVFAKASDGFLRSAGGGKYDSYFVGQLQALEDLKLIEPERIKAVLDPGKRKLCGCWF
jgi:hypothetical protein